VHNVSSPRTDDEGLEGAIRAAGADKAPRVTPADIEAAIQSQWFFTAHDGVAGAPLGDVNDGPWPPALDLLTFCVLVLRNGFTVTGESACASPENFNPDIGRKVARANAVQKIWPLLGFRLRDQLYEADMRKADELDNI
jgi:Phage protein (N4 Gp49/phage Sf6 gene 66) family